MKENLINVNLFINNSLFNFMKNILCFGGGNAMPKVVLEELKKYPVKITTVTSMVDSGGSTGKLRKEMDVLPPGDIRRHLLALSNAPEWKKKLFDFRFGNEEFEGGHKGNSFGNIFIAGLEVICKDFQIALNHTSEFLEVKGTVLPATTDKTHIYATLENGDEIKGEDEIDVPKNHNPNLKIRDVYLKPKAKAYSKVLQTIEKADLIILGPGDIYSSIIPCFLPEGIKEAMQKTKAKKIFICPIMTKSGETQEFNVSDFAEKIEKYIGCELDSVIFNNFIPGKQTIEEYRKKYPELIDVVNFQKLPNMKKYIGKNLLLKNDSMLHDSKKLMEIINTFI